LGSDQLDAYCEDGTQREEKNARNPGGRLGSCIRYPGNLYAIDGKSLVIPENAAFDFRRLTCTAFIGVIWSTPEPTSAL